MSILDVLGPYKLLIEVAVLGSLALGATVKVHHAIEAHDEHVRDGVRAEYAQKFAEAKDAARQRETAMQTQINDAVKKGQEREKTIQTLAAASSAASLSLRDTINSISSRVPSFSEDALRSLTSAYGVLSAECAARRIEVAKDAEGRNSNVKTMIEAWPADTGKK